MSLPPVQPRSLGPCAQTAYWLMAAALTLQILGTASLAAGPQTRASPSPNPKTAAATTAAVPPKAAKANLLPCWKIRQDSRITGTHTVYFNKTAIKDYYERTGVITICRAPDWNVVSYHPATKRAYSQKLKRFAGFLQREIEIFSGKTFMDMPMTATSSSKAYNQNATTYVSSAAMTQKIKAQYRSGEVDGSTPATVTMLSVANDDCSAPINELLCKVYGLPRVAGLPVKCDVLEVDLTKRNFLSTSSLTKGAVPVSEFETPATLTKVNSMAEVVSQEDPNDKGGLFQLVEGDNPRKSPTADKAKGR